LIATEEDEVVDEAEGKVEDEEDEDEEDEVEDDDGLIP
jgi:hypothetical protein